MEWEKVMAAVLFSHSLGGASQGSVPFLTLPNVLSRGIGLGSNCQNLAL